MSIKEGEDLITLALKREDVGDYQGAIEHLGKVKHRSHQRRLLKLKARNYNNLGEFKEALNCASLLLATFKNTPFIKDCAKAMQELMIATVGLKQDEASEKIGKDAALYMYQNKLNDTAIHARFYITCAKIGMMYKNSSAMLEGFTKAKDILSKIDSSEKHYVIVSFGFGEYCSKYCKKYSEAIKHYQDAIYILDCTYPGKTIYRKAAILQRLASSYIALNQWELALACFKDSHGIVLTLLGPYNDQTKCAHEQILLIQCQLQCSERERPCSMCGTFGASGTGGICGKQACMEKAWIIRGGMDSLACRGCKKYFAILNAQYFCKTCKP